MSFPKPLSISFSAALLKEAPHIKAEAARSLYTYLTDLPNPSIRAILSEEHTPDDIFRPLLRASFYEACDPKRVHFDNAAAIDDKTPISVRLVGDDVFSQAPYILTGEICIAALSTEQLAPIHRLGFTTREVSGLDLLKIEFRPAPSTEQVVDTFGFGGSFGASYQ